MQRFLAFVAIGLALPVLAAVKNDGSELDDVDAEGHHHHHHHHHKGKKGPKAAVATEPHSVVKAAVQADAHVGNNIVDRMKKLEARLALKTKALSQESAMGHLLVNGPLPADFNERFVQAVAHATGTETSKVTVKDTTAVEDNADVYEVTFDAPPKIVKSVEDDAADPNSKLAKGNMRPFLVAKDSKESAAPTNFAVKSAHSSAPSAAPKPVAKATRVAVRAPEQREATPIQEKGIDIDTAMPYGDLEPFGREDTAQELTESSVKESDEMVDQLERAEVAEEKRSVFRALTRLRGAAITSFDGVARSQTGNIDEYNKVHKWRKTHPLHHLANEESDVTKWAFPDNADFIQYSSLGYERTK